MNSTAFPASADFRTSSVFPSDPSRHPSLGEAKVQGSPKAAQSKRAFFARGWETIYFEELTRGQG
jgi:hypothetical protein